MRSIFYAINVFVLFLVLQIVGLNTNILTAQDLSAVHDTVSLNTNESLNIPVLDNDTGGGITVTQFVQPKHGSVNLDELTNQFTYTPNAGYYGRDIFVYQITDSLGQTARASVFIVVHHNGTAPLTITTGKDCDQYGYTVYFKITGGISPYIVSGDYNDTFFTETTFYTTKDNTERYDISITDAAVTVVNINNLTDLLPCISRGIIDIE